MHTLVDVGLPAEYGDTLTVALDLPYFRKRYYGYKDFHYVRKTGEHNHKLRGSPCRNNASRSWKSAPAIAQVVPSFCFCARFGHLLGHIWNMLQRLAQKKCYAGEFTTRGGGALFYVLLQGIYWYSPDPESCETLEKVLTSILEVVSLLLMERKRLPSRRQHLNPRAPLKIDNKAVSPRQWCS